MNGLNYSIWIAELRSMFPVEEEFSLARAIYPFEEDHLAGMTPKQSYAAFDAWAVSDEEAA